MDINAKITKKTVKSMLFPDKEVTTLECKVDAAFDPASKLNEVRIEYKDGNTMVYKLDLLRR